MDIQSVKNLKEKWDSEFIETKSRLIDEVLNKDSEIQMLRAELKDARESIIKLETVISKNHLGNFIEKEEKSITDIESNNALLENAGKIHKDFADILQKVLSNEPKFTTLTISPEIGIGDEGVLYLTRAMLNNFTINKCYLGGNLYLFTF